MTETADPRSDAVRDDLGQALGSLLRRYHQALRGVVEQLPGGPRGYQVMAVANGDACSSQAAIAESLGIDRTVMTYLVDDLEKAGLAERRPDPADRRARRVVLTDKGRGVFAAAAQQVAETERTILGVLSEAEAEQFRALLARIAAVTPAVDPGLMCSGDDDSC